MCCLSPLVTKSRVNRTVVPEKTNIVKKKLDEKNYVALTGLRMNLSADVI